MFKTVAARGFVNGRGPVLPTRGIGPKVRSFEHIPSYSSLLFFTEKNTAGTFDHVRQDAAEFVL